MKFNFTKRSQRALQLLLLTLAIPFLAGAGDDEARFNKVGHEMMCACGCSQILLECNHVGCTYSDKMRNELSAAVQRGDNDDLILSTFVGNYGPAILAAPIRGGFDRVAWITPFVVFALAIGVAVWIIRVWKSRGGRGSGGNGGSGPSGGAVAIAVPELDRFREQARKETEL